MKNIPFVTGLPRSGSTLLCNILAQHKDIDAAPSSPLCHIVQNMKRQWSDDAFLLAQLDNNFDGVYVRLKRSTRAFMDSWCSDTDSKFTIDKNRGWLGSCELVRELYPEMKMIVCIRDLRSIFASIEKQHRKTLLLDFPDHMDGNIVDNRARILFESNGVIGGPLGAINNLYDIANIMPHIYFFRYEDFVQDPKKSLDDVTKWLGAKKFKYNLKKIEQKTVESDSHYRFKYIHTIQSEFKPAESFEESQIPPRVSNEILNRFKWYYGNYYQDVVLPEGPRQAPVMQRNPEEKNNVDLRVEQEVEEALDVLDF